MWGESDLPHYNALFLVFILTFLNLMSIPTGIDIITGGHLIKDTSLNKLLFACIMLAVFLMEHRLLVSGNKFRNTAKHFRDENINQRRTRLIGIWVYIIASFSLFFVLLAIRDS
jgi:hypothetical protein